MRNREDFVTVNARRSGHLQAWFEASMQNGFEGFTLAMTPPEASTGGGARARQHIVLTPREGGALVVGWANVAEKTAELRTLGYLLAVSRERYGVEPSIPAKDYVAFLVVATTLLRELGLQVAEAAVPPADAGTLRPPAAAAPRRDVPSRLASAVVVLASVAAAVSAIAWLVSR